MTFDLPLPLGPTIAEKLCMPVRGVTARSPTRLERQLLLLVLLTL